MSGEYSQLSPAGAEPNLPEPSGWDKIKKVLAPLAVVGVLLVKFKGLLVPLLKFFPFLAKTGGSMFLMIWVYAQMWGLWFAFGFVVLLLVHECGHLVAAKRLGLNVGAPVFIPFMGAFIAMKDAPRNAWVEAQIGIGGPLLGTAGAALCYCLYPITGQPIFSAIAYIGFLLNLFNLAPIGILDGGRIVTAISPWLWVVGTAVMVVLLIQHFNFLLCLILVISLPRLFSLFRKRSVEEDRYFEVTPGQRWTMTFLYFGLAGLLALAMQASQVQP